MIMAYQRVVANIVLIISSLLLIFILPVHTLITINLAIISTTLSHKLYWEIRLKEKPILKEWSVSLIKTIFWVSIFYIAYILAGLMGWVGIILLSVVLAAWRIYQGKDLFDRYTKWASDRAWGRTKEGFNFLEAMSYGEESSEGKFKVDNGKRFEGQSDIGFEKSEDDACEQEYCGEGSEKVQVVYRRHSSPGKSGLRGRKKKFVQDLSDDLGSRK